jgi:hypothetical protein
VSTKNCYLSSTGADLEIDMKVLAWLGNQLRPESLFQKDLDIDPFIASTPEAIQAEYEDMQVYIGAPCIIAVFVIQAHRFNSTILSHVEISSALRRARNQTSTTAVFFKYT